MATSKPTAASESHREAHDRRILANAAALMRQDPALSATSALRNLDIVDRASVRRLRPLLIKQANASPPDRALPPAPLRASDTKKVGKVDTRPRRPASPEPARARRTTEPVPLPEAARSPLPETQPRREASAPSTDNKTAPPPRAKSPARQPSPAAADPLGLARPWLMLGVHSTAALLTMQARMAQAALQTPAVSAAMRQSTQLMMHMLALWAPPKRKD